MAKRLLWLSCALVSVDYYFLFVAYIRLY
jgi:hypothetical protein